MPGLVSAYITLFPDAPLAVTIYDIAAHAEVSIATVSRVFNNSPRVSDETRQRVQHVARTMGYRPHAMAQGLARQSTNLVSAVIPVLTNYFYMEVLRGMQDALAASDFDLIVYSAATPEEVDGQLARALQRGRSEGLLVLSTPLSDERRRRLASARQAVVLVDTEHPDFDSILVDNREGAIRATRHLIERGYERIAHITVHPEPPPARERREGYEQAMAEAGREPLIVASDRRPYGFCEESGYEAMRTLIGRAERPDAVFVASDVQALGALCALQDAGLTVPDDMAIVGFDDIKVSAYARLTTLRQPMYEMGMLAVERLLAHLADPDLLPRRHLFIPDLVCRTSSGSGA